MTDIYDLRGADDDEDDLNLDGAGWYGMTFKADDGVTTADLSVFIKHLNFDESQAFGSTGTGIFNPFLNLNGGETLVGFNLQDSSQQQNTANGTDISNPNTNAIQVGDIPIIYLDLDGLPGLEAYYVINLDINENTNLDVALSELQIFVSGSEANFGDYIYDTDPSGLAFASTGDGGSQDYSLVFDLDAEGTGGDKTLILSDLGAGQGKQDYIFYLPVELFEEAGATQDSYMTLFSQFGPTPPDDAGFAEWNTIVAPKVSGVKFEDENGDGNQDVGENGLAGFTMFIDIDGDGLYDPGELTAVSGVDGFFEFASLVDADSYQVYEILSEDDLDTVNNTFSTDEINALLPVPDGDWILTTGTNGGHDIVLDGDEYVAVAVGNFLADPGILIEKEAISIIPDGGGDNKLVPGADTEGDVVNYVISVTNTGNLDLTNVFLLDINADTLVRGDDISGNNDDILDVGETWFFTSTHVVDQSTLDSDGINELGIGDGDQDIDNRVDVTADWAILGESGSVSDYDIEGVPVVYSPDLDVSKEFVRWQDDEATGDTAGDVAIYKVTVTNTGNITLTNVTVVDPLTGQNVLIAELAPGASQSYDTSYTIDQGDLDTKGDDADTLAGLTPDTDTKVDNQVTADSDQTGPETAEAEAPLLYNPDLDVSKEFVRWQDDEATGDTAGDVAIYKVTVTNTGNITLTNVTVVDPLTGQNVLIAELAPGASQSYDTSYTIDQGDLDTKGDDADTLAGLTPDTDTKVDNQVTADSDQTGPETAEAEAPLLYNPVITVTKDVSVDQGAGYIDFVPADSATGPQATLNADPIFRVTVTNGGNITLTGVTLVDTVNPEIGLDYVVDYAASAMVDLDGDNVGDISFTDWETANDGVADGKFDLAVGDDVTIIYSIPFAVGQHENQVIATTDQGASDDDFAYYFGLINDGPGVRTPGFWQNENNGLLYWDGIPDNQPHEGDNFPDGDLLYAVDSNNDGFINAVAGDGINDDKPLDGPGLLIGDFNKNGITDDWEDTLFINYDDAVALVEHSETKSNDGGEKVGRDLVATWLNYLAGNNVGSTDPNNLVEGEPSWYIQEAVDWLQTFSGKTGGQNNTTEDFDIYFPKANVKSNSDAWKEGIDDDSPSGAEIHAALDSYNNDGSIGGVAYAGDADSVEFQAALSQIISVQEDLALQVESLDFAATYNTLDGFKDDAMIYQDSAVIA
jgi:uncharacterized repeat protein (TIGR01451 family)